MFLVSIALWLYGYQSNNGALAVISAGVMGGILYDIAVSRGEYVLPKPDTDGINLGSLYGAIVGFSVAIAILQPLYATSTPTGASVYTSFDAFLIAVGVKTGSEFASTVRMELVKTPSSISYDAKDLKTTSQPKTVTGALLDKDDKPLKSKVVHIFVKDTASGGTQTSRDTLTTEKMTDGVNFTYQLQLPTQNPTTWESWASWDGDDTNQPAESKHETFTV